jgi:hypothetical protein
MGGKIVIRQKKSKWQKKTQRAFALLGQFYEFPQKNCFLDLRWGNNDESNARKSQIG